jgi:hypothetical protein
LRPIPTSETYKRNLSRGPAKREITSLLTGQGQGRGSRALVDAKTLADARSEQNSFVYDATFDIEQIALTPASQLWRYDDYPWPGAEPEPLW